MEGLRRRKERKVCQQLVHSINKAPWRISETWHWWAVVSAATHTFFIMGLRLTSLWPFQAQVQDIEQLVSVGRELGACPYYGVRYAIPAAQVSGLLCSPLWLYCSHQIRLSLIFACQSHHETLNDKHSLNAAAGTVCWKIIFSDLVTKYCLLFLFIDCLLC